MKKIIATAALVLCACFSAKAQEDLEMMKIFISTNYPTMVGFFEYNSDKWSHQKYQEEGSNHLVVFDSEIDVQFHIKYDLTTNRPLWVQVIGKSDKFYNDFMQECKTSLMKYPTTESCPLCYLDNGVIFHFEKMIDAGALVYCIRAFPTN